MEGRDQRASGAGRGGHLAFAALVAAAYLSLFGAPPGFLDPRLVSVALLAGVVYAALGTAGFDRVERADSRGAALAYFAVQIPLGVAIVALCGGASGIVLLLLPLAGQTVRVLPRLWAAAVCALLLASVVVSAGFLVGWAQAVQGGFGILAALVFAVVFSQVALNEQRARAELDEANEKLREYSARVEKLATIQERSRLAREIHDGLGHYLTVIHMQLQAADAVFGSDPARARQVVNKARELSREALAEVRRSVAALRASPIEGKSLPETLQGLTEETRAVGVPAELVVSGVPQPLSPQTEQALFRAAQEGLTNVRKHARASRAPGA